MKAIIILPVLLLLCCAAPGAFAQSNSVPQSIAVADDGTIYVLFEEIASDGSAHPALAAYQPDGTGAGDFKPSLPVSVLPLSLHAVSDTLIVSGTALASTADADFFAMAVDPDLLVAVEEVPALNSFALDPGYPNPVSEDAAVVNYSVPYLSSIRVEVRALSGKIVETLVDEIKTEGQYRAVFHPRDLPSGSYYIMLYSPEGVLVRKIALLR